MLALQWSLSVIALFLALPCVSPRPYILFANRKDIRLMEVTDNKRKVATNIIVKNLEDAAAIDYFLELNQVCWSEINREVIRCAEIDPRARGKVTKTNIVTTGLIKPEGLACDWVNNKLYWTDSDTKRIEVTGLSGRDSDRTVLVWQNLDLPRAISVAPNAGYMFWSDWGEYPKIERCGMNGDPKTRKVLVDNDLVWPNGLTLDYENKRLYWVEAQLAYIASIDWDGFNRKTILIGDRANLPQPFAITTFAGVLYWTDWDTNAVHLCNQTGNEVGKLKIRGKLSPMDIRVFEPTRQEAGDSPCKSRNGGCSHICLASPNPPRFSCKCPTGFKLLNATTCASANTEILLLAAREHIIKVSLDTPDYTGIVIPLKTVVNSIAIDYDPVSNRVFWTDLADDQKQAIRSAHLDGSGESNVVVSDVYHPDGIAVDWIAGNLFWTDSGTDRIEVARLDGENRRVIISEDLDEPRSIVLDLVNGWMYWSDWGKNPRIERAWMDGRERSVIIDTELVWPNGIAVDIGRQKLYWCDAKLDRIEMSNVDGTERVTIIDTDLPHPFGFTMLGSSLYWTDWQDRNIQRANKISGKERTVLVSHLDDLMGVKAVSISPSAEITNPCIQRRCSHICLMTPAGEVCSCPNDYELTADNRTCVIPEAFLLYTRRDDIRRISVDTPNTNILIPLKGVQEASALDFDRDQGMIYWSDIEMKTISRAFLNGSSQEIVIEFGLDFPEGLAVDWLARNLYWADAGTGRIEMSRLDGTNRRVLLWQNIQNPKSLVVDPARGFLYWSAWGKDPSIERASLDGLEREVVAAEAGRATGLTLDGPRHQLYWADQDSFTIQAVDVSGPMPGTRIALLIGCLFKFLAVILF
jgi:low density lipoprotein receptor-related protein 5/6